MKIDPAQLPAHLRAEAPDDEFAAGIGGGGIDMPVLSLRGKEFRFRYQGNETSTRSRELDIILLRGRPHMSKRWYQESYSAGSIDMPDCWSLDGARPDVNAKAPQSDRCSTCPRNQFGSKITPGGKQGKECADYKRFVVLPVLDGRVTSQPVILDLPIMSLRKARGDRSDNMFLQEYVGALSRHSIKPYGVVTRLEFTDAEYPQVAFTMHRATTAEEYQQIVAMREDDLVQDALGEPQVEGSGPIRESEAPVEQVLNIKPAPAPEPEPVKADPPKPKPAPEVETKAET
ncbi:MAG: hypothetical protein EA406_05520, partial [Rhodospirillales bacterium]